MDNSQDQTQNSFTLSDIEYQTLLSSLNRKLKLIEETDSEKEFFLLVAEFYKFITSNNVTTKAIDVMFQQYQAEIETIDNLRKKTFEEAQDVFEKIKSLALEKKLVTEEQLELLEKHYIQKEELSEAKQKIVWDNSNPIFVTFREYYSWLAGKTQSLSGVSFEISIKGGVERIIQAIYHDVEHKDLVTKYVEIQKDSEGKEYINNYLVTPSAQDFSDLKKIVDRKLELSGWNLLHKLELVPLCAFDYPTLWKQLNQEDRLAEMMALGSYISEMTNILEENSTKERHYFKVKEYRLYLSIFQDRLLEILQLANKLSETNFLSSNNSKDLNILSGLIKERPKHLPESATPAELAERLLLEETPEGDFLLKLGSHRPIRFQANQDISYMVNVFCVYKEKWINFELIYAAVWGKNDYKEQQAQKNKPVHDKIRSIISAIRTKLRQADLGESILIESGHDKIGAQGEGWFRLHIVTA